MSWLDNLNLSQDRICRALGWEHFILVAHVSSCVKCFGDLLRLFWQQQLERS